MILGDPNPDWRGTLGLTARLSNFTVNMLFEHSEGGEYSPRTLWVLRRFGTTSDTDNEVTLTKDLKNVDGKTNGLLNKKIKNLTEMIDEVKSKTKSKWLLESYEYYQY